MALVKSGQKSAPSKRKANAASALSVVVSSNGLPTADSLAALRAWYEGLTAREAVRRYLGNAKADGQSSRAILTAVRVQLARAAERLHRPDLEAALLGTGEPSATGARKASLLNAAVDALVATPRPTPQLTDGVERWFTHRTATALQRSKIRTLAELTLRVPRRKMWWRGVEGLGAVGAKKVEEFFAAHPGLIQQARALVPVPLTSEVAPWESIQLPRNLDGSAGAYRGPLNTCALSARNDHEAVTAWIERHESPATQRAYRKEAERLILWAIVERKKPLSSLSAEDATAYRAFLRWPTPHLRWVGPSRPRLSPEWKPFAGALSSRSIAYSLTVLNSLFRWLVEQRYLLVNPFSGLKVRGGKAGTLDPARSFTEGEWSLIRTVADGLEWSYGWGNEAAERVRFLLDFSYSTGLRAGEFVRARLGDIRDDETIGHWLELDGKGGNRGRVVLPPMARAALDRYLMHRGLPITPAKWVPSTQIVGRVQSDDGGSISTTRLWAVCKRFFSTAADVLRESSPALAAKLLDATPHWMRHTHATHSLQRGVELTTVRDNLRHASIATTSTYLHSDDGRRMRQVGQAFPAA